MIKVCCIITFAWPRNSYVVGGGPSLTGSTRAENARKKIQDGSRGFVGDATRRDKSTITMRRFSNIGSLRLQSTNDALVVHSPKLGKVPICFIFQGFEVQARSKVNICSPPAPTPFDRSLLSYRVQWIPTFLSCLGDHCSH